MRVSVAVLRVAAVVVSMTLVVACTSQASKPAVSPMAPAATQSYVPRASLPNSLSLLPAPPAAGSAALTADEETYRTTRALRDTPRWVLAAQDADLSFPAVLGTFSCAIGAPISEEATPHLYTIMRRTLIDSAVSTDAAKKQYMRRRPFMVYNEPSCRPGDQPILEKNGSYPSGHSAVGWVWALILAEAVPERADAVLSRGYAFGQSRVVCGVHWQSDVSEGRVIGAAVVARLHADQAFNADVAAAKAELSAVRAKGLSPERDCTAEASALSTTVATGR